MANSIDIVLSDYLEAVDDYFRMKDSLAGQMKQVMSFHFNYIAVWYTVFVK